ncbi:MAG TPA: pyruvate formate lyase family protein [Allosphingosinicella sp.]|nr:pyruvate formate lyase family protein [Allosphingosinicella sp.]
MHRNILEFWQHLENLGDGHADRPSPRACRLMSGMFEQWRTRAPFPARDGFGHLRDHLAPDEAGLMAEPVAVRRGHAMAKSLRMIGGAWGKAGGFFRVDADELIVGNMPPYSVGQGKELMAYLKGAEDDFDERLSFEADYLNPWSNFGHVCPDHEKIVRRGVRSIIEECREARAASAEAGRQAFYLSVEIALQGVIDFAAGYAREAAALASLYARELADRPDHPMRAIFEQRRTGMEEAAERLLRIPAEPCRTFLDAVQCIFLMNCALHWTGELTSLGRLDQILDPFLERDGLTDAQAQEIVDCLWIKLDERVTLDNRHLEDHFTSADGALLGSGGASNFDQGALANQWMQQVTIGGVVADSGPIPRDACNRVTRLCLQASRRLPFNAPTLDLRVHKDTPLDVLELAADALLSGGAHPIILNDDKIVPALRKAGPGIDLATARNYACDGCYETHFPGETEFSFFYVPGLAMLEKALNGGAGFGSAGPTFMRGMKDGYRTRDAADVGSFEELYDLFEEHIRLSVHRGLRGVLRAYGSKAKVCPTPILSAMIEDCIAAGRDFYDGGARHHVFAPLMTGISTVADSLFAIDALVFRDRKVGMRELVGCLRSDWGERGVVVGPAIPDVRIQEIRALCLAQPKFGHGDSSVDLYAWRVIDSFVDAFEAALAHPLHREALADLAERFGTPDRPFNLVFTPGVGTFEQYVFGGSFAGATADGRKSGQAIASDLSAAPVPQDMDPLGETGLPVRAASLRESLASWNHDSVNRLSDGAPSDYNIREDFPREALIEVLRGFANGEGGNIMTVTVGNPETLQAAEAKPFDHDLLRVRMGGWTEFFSVLFPDHKKQHRRRPLYVD